jgi:hypothetical protein
VTRICSLVFAVLVSAAPALAQDVPPAIDYRVLATSRTSTMQEEMNQAARDGYRYAAVMGGETAFGGNEVVTVMMRTEETLAARYEYRLLATNRTSTMERELRGAAAEGFEYKGQTVFSSTFGGDEVACILERRIDQPSGTKADYRLVATSRTGTFQRELREAGAAGYEIVGMTVGQTAFGGAELVAILQKR